MDFMIGDIREKESAAPKAPSFPQLKSTTTGFPDHKKRISAFKQKRNNIKLLDENNKVYMPGPKAPETVPTVRSDAAQRQQPTIPKPGSRNIASDERRNIDRENNQKIASMSPEEIERTRQELFGDLHPSVLEMLLKRANLDQPNGPSPFDEPSSNSTPQTVPTDAQPAQDTPEIRIEDTSVQPSKSISDSKVVGEPTATNDSKRVRFASVADEEEEEAQTVPKTKSDSSPHNHTHDHDHTTAQHHQPANHPTEPAAAAEPAPKPHWPQPPQPGDLDPHDPDFLSKMHSKYFPSLPADPSKLAWMAPIPTTNSPADLDSPYHPHQSTLPVDALRFDFRGALLPPRIARAVPVTKGLHHHGEAPEAAGYTVKELARLCRSAVPGQRCVAYQTLGRVLYRLGAGEFGGVGAGEMSVGLWQQVLDGEVLASLYAEAAAEEGRGHRSARAFAVEAVWLCEKGGWKDRLRKAKSSDLE
ncbi:hypothetical protein F4819DRAFT_490987 [Hypoxylon fuscum]|nr:hypothetical protein F4819DRAFT_490987 [Hypoxylon fuscum]